MLSVMQVLDELPIVKGSRRMYTKRFISYHKNTDTHNSGPSVFFCSAKEKIAHKKNIIMQSKLNWTVDKLNLQKETTTKIIRCDALRFRQRSRILEYLRNIGPLSVEYETRMEVEEDQNSGSILNNRNVCRPKSSTPVTSRKNHLSYINAPFTPMNSTVLRLPFHERKHLSVTNNSNKVTKANIEQQRMMEKTKLKSTNRWTSAVDGDVCLTGIKVEIQDKSNNSNSEDTIGSLQVSSKQLCKTRNYYCMKNKRFDRSYPGISVVYEDDRCQGESEDNDNDYIDCDTSFCEGDESHFTPIDNDECVKIVKKVKTLELTTNTSDVLIPANYISSIKKTSSIQMENTKVWTSLNVDYKRSKVSIPSGRGSADLNELLKVERARYATSQARLTEFMQHLTM